MYDDLTAFSVGQAITVSAASNYAGTGAGSAGAGVLDTGVLVPSVGGAGGFGQMGRFGGSPIKFNLIVSVGQLFVGPVGAGLLVFLQDSPDNVTWTNTMIGPITAIPTATLLPGLVIFNVPLPATDAEPLPTSLAQYLRMYYTVSNGPFTGGTINARLEVM